MKKTRKQNKKGFTLIELMVVVIIVGILAAVAVPLYLFNVKKSKASEGAALMGSVLTAERVYYAQNSAYTADTNTVTDPSPILGISCAGNKYFPTFTAALSANGFTATATSNAAGGPVAVQEVYTTAAGATLNWDPAGGTTWQAW